tara:strand:- start:73 stop:921 length:849 start_codon:yes stop_codon:yes gene_type:complete
MMGVLMELLFNLDDIIDKRVDDPDELAKKKERCAKLPQVISHLIEDVTLVNCYDKATEVHCHFAVELARNFARMLDTALLLKIPTSSKRNAVKANIKKEMHAYLNACVNPIQDPHLNPINYRGQRILDGAVKLVEQIERGLSVLGDERADPSDNFAFLLGLVNDIFGLPKDIQRQDEEGSIFCCYGSDWENPDKVLQSVNKLMAETWINCAKEHNPEMERWHTYHVLWCLSFQKRYGAISEKAKTPEATAAQFKLLQRFINPTVADAALDEAARLKMIEKSP